MKTFRLGLATLLPLLLMACSSTTFVYNRLDIVIPWLVGGYVDLDKRQDNSLDQLLDDYLNRHRREHLPRYVAILDQGLATLDSDIGSAELADLYRQVEVELRREQSQSLGWILTVGESLSDDQIAEFIANLRDKQTELEEKYLERDDEEFREETDKELRKYLDDYLGSLNGQQKASLKNLADGLIRFDQLWLDEREQWVAELENLLRREPGWQQQVRELVINRYDRTRDDYKNVYNRNLELTLETVAQVVDGRSAQQDRHLRRKLISMRDDMCLLVAEGGSAGGHQSAAQAPCPATASVASNPALGD